MNHNKGLINLFINELSIYLNRSANVILEEGLLATDFNTCIRLVYEDGSYIHYQNAFLVKKENGIGVFTEHCGYHIFSEDAFDDYVTDAPNEPIYPRD